MLSRAEQITQLYHNLLGRDPDPGGFNYFLGSNMDIDSITSQILNSSEYLSTHSTATVTHSGGVQMGTPVTDYQPQIGPVQISPLSDIIQPNSLNTTFQTPDNSLPVPDYTDPAQAYLNNKWGLSLQLDFGVSPSDVIKMYYFALANDPTLTSRLSDLIAAYNAATTPVNSVVKVNPTPGYSGGTSLIDIPNNPLDAGTVLTMVAPVQLTAPPTTLLPTTGGLPMEFTKAENNFLNSNTGIILQMEKGYSIQQTVGAYHFALNHNQVLLDDPASLAMAYGGPVQPVTSPIQTVGPTQQTVAAQVNSGSQAIYNQVANTTPTALGSLVNLGNLATPSMALANPISSLTQVASAANASANAAATVAQAEGNNVMVPALIGLGLLLYFFKK